MGSYTVDLQTGARTWQLPLEQLPFRSRVGAPVGAMEISCGPDGRVTDVSVKLEVPKPFLLDELPRLAAEATWDVPVDEIKATRAAKLQLALALKANLRGRLGAYNLRQPAWDVFFGENAFLLDDQSYILADIYTHQE